MDLTQNYTTVRVSGVIPKSLGIPDYALYPGAIFTTKGTEGQEDWDLFDDQTGEIFKENLSEALAKKWVGILNRHCKKMV